jgi:hypothetical protein
MLLFGRKIANIKYVERNAIESFNQDLWITTTGRKASAENVNDHCRLCINLSFETKIRGNRENILYIVGEFYV